MNSLSDAWKRTLVRAVVVAAAGILVGVAFYQLDVFIPTRRASQFALSSIAIGIMYAALKSGKPRNGLAALFVLYIVTVGLLVPFNWWLLILDLAYIGVMAGAVAVQQRIVQKPLVLGPVMRIALGGALVSLANGLIIVLLALFHLQWALSHFGRYEAEILHNLQLGALIGLATASGMELAEYLDRRLYGERAVSEDSPTLDAPQ